MKIEEVNEMVYVLGHVVRSLGRRGCGLGLVVRYCTTTADGTGHRRHIITNSRNSGVPRVALVDSRLAAGTRTDA